MGTCNTYLIVYRPYSLGGLNQLFSHGPYLTHYLESKTLHLHSSPNFLKLLGYRPWPQVIVILPNNLRHDPRSGSVPQGHLENKQNQCSLPLNESVVLYALLLLLPPFPTFSSFLFSPQPIIPFFAYCNLFFVSNVCTCTCCKMDIFWKHKNINVMSSI